MRATVDNNKLTDSILIQHAVGFAAAADAYAKIDKLRDWFVLYFLMGHGIELALKAYAIKTGANESDLKKFGHRLGNALEYAHKNGFLHESPLTDAERGAIELLDKWHATAITRYPLMQGYTIPNPSLVRRTLDKLIRAAYISIRGMDAFEEDRANEHGLGLSIDPDAQYSADAKLVSGD